MKLQELIALTESKSDIKKMGAFKKSQAFKTAKKFLTIKKHDTKLWDKLNLEDSQLKADLISAYMSKNSKTAITKIIKSTDKEEFLIAVNALAKAHGGVDKFTLKLKNNKTFLRAIEPFIDEAIIDATSDEDLKTAIEKHMK